MLFLTWEFKRWQFPSAMWSTLIQKWAWDFFKLKSKYCRKWLYLNIKTWLYSYFLDDLYQISEWNQETTTYHYTIFTLSSDSRIVTILESIIQNFPFLLELESLWRKAKTAFCVITARLISKKRIFIRHSEKKLVGLTPESNLIKSFRR